MYWNRFSSTSKATIRLSSLSFISTLAAMCWRHELLTCKHCCWKHRCNVNRRRNVLSCIVIFEQHLYGIVCIFDIFTEWTAWIIYVEIVKSLKIWTLVWLQKNFNYFELSMNFWCSKFEQTILCGDIESFMHFLWPILSIASLNINNYLMKFLYLFPDRINIYRKSTNFVNAQKKLLFKTDSKVETLFFLFKRDSKLKRLWSFFFIKTRVFETARFRFDSFDECAK